MQPEALQLNSYILSTEQSTNCLHEQLSSAARNLKSKDLNLWSLKLHRQRTRDCLSGATTMFVWVSISKWYLFCSGVISLEPENILVSPENPFGDSASHLHCLSQFYLFFIEEQLEIKQLKDIFTSFWLVEVRFVFINPTGFLWALEITHRNSEFQYYNNTPVIHVLQCTSWIQIQMYFKLIIEFLISTMKMETYSMLYHMNIH